MEGVDILNEYTVPSQWSFNYWIALGIFGIVFIFTIIASIRSGEFEVLWLNFIGIIFALLAGAMGGFLFPLEDQLEKRYEVIINDSVSFSDFNAKYEILDQEGKIYTVREREKLK